ncbi:MAG: serine/threonine-protein kinase [Pirellulaceae bacterium]|nr:serine/threonine-protein kinase [Pirellulaceae bacterium]
MFARSMFRNLALLSGLVTQEQLDQVVATLRSQPQPGLPPAPMLDVDDEQLAAKLVELGILTPYQLKELKAGRSKFNLGSYTITDWIGQGGMGHVYKGVHQVMGRECAIKTLPLVKATPESISNFNREIRTQAQLDHPHLVRAYDAGKDGNIYYMAVEYVPGTDLRKLVRSQGPLTQTQAASVILQTARGLEYAHGKGLIHRDIKPGNILVTAQGIAKLSDLGLAGFLHDAENDPRAGKIVGTADYLSPEQIRSPGDITLTTDIYSLGCTLYYAVCGKVPFPGGTARDKARRHCEETPWHPRRFNPDLHEEFVEVIADMMEKDPKARIQTAAEVVARLEQFAENATPLKTPASIKSPWSSQPLPSGEFEKEEVGQDTDGGEVSASEASASHGSQGTGAVASGTQETMPVKPGRHRPLPVAQAVPLPEPFSATAIVALTLVISIPLSMAAGALVAALAFWLFN